MSTEIADGLTLSAIGLVVAFTFMGIFILIMVVLQRMFPVKKVGPTAVESTGEQVVPSISKVAAQHDEEQAVAAAIAIGLQIARARRTSTLGAGLETGRGVWWMANQVVARQNGVQIRKSTR